MWRYALPDGIQHSTALGHIKAAHWDRMSYHEFCAMDIGYQEYIIAAYLTTMQCDAVEIHEARK